MDWFDLLAVQGTLNYINWRLPTLIVLTLAYMNDFLIAIKTTDRLVPAGYQALMGALY